MTIHISRDYNPITTGYNFKAYSPTMYQLAIFLHRILGFTVVGNNGFDIDIPLTTLTVIGASNTYPIEITTSVNHGFSNRQGVSISGVGGNTAANGSWTINVTAPDKFTLISSGGNGAFTTGGTVVSGFVYASGLAADGYGAGINFGSGAFYEVSIPISNRKVVAGDISKMLVLKSPRFPTKNSGCFKITAINQGNNTTVALASSGTTTIAAASNGASLPQATINVASTANFPTSGSIFVTTSAGIQTVTYTGKGATTFTGCTGGTGTMSTGGTVTNTIATLPQPIINVASTTGFPASGTIFITLASTGTTQVVTYTGTTATTFTGCSGGTGIMTVGDTVANLNRYVIDYKATENPPVEPANSIDWWLYEIENTASNQMTTHLGAGGVLTATGATNTTPIQLTGVSTVHASTYGMSDGQEIIVSGVVGNTAANGRWTITDVNASTISLNGSVGNGTYISGGSFRLAGYAGDKASYISRIILQSPHSSGWQVRIATEPTSSSLPYFSVSTGYGGDSFGDFPVGGVQTHPIAFLDYDPTSANPGYDSITPGGGENAVHRLTIVGDEKSVFFWVRPVSGGGATTSGIHHFGIPENEPVPTPLNEHRIFSYGGVGNNGGGNPGFGTIAFRIGSGAQNVGMAFRNGSPKFCSLTGWANLNGTSSTSPMFFASAGDCPFTSSTEVLPVEIWSGVVGDVGLSGGVLVPFFFNQYFMGTSPILRAGRSNFGNFTLTSEETTSRTVTAATNTSPIQITTSVANALVTGQTVTVSEVGGNTAANGTWVITVINNQNFTLNGSVGNGAYTSGGFAKGCPGWLHLLNGIYVKWNGALGLTA